MKSFIRKNIIIVSAALLIVMLLCNTVTTIYSNRILERTTNEKIASKHLLELGNDLFYGTVRDLDIGVRSFALTQDEQLLGPFQYGVESHERRLNEMEKKLKEREYTDLADFNKLKVEMQEYVKVSINMVEMVKTGSMDLFQEELKKNKGLAVWNAYDPFMQKLSKIENERSKKADEEYEASMRNMLIVQLLLALLGIPTLLFMITRIRKDVKERMKLFVELEKNNRAYLFDPGNDVEVMNEQELINNSIYNFKKAAGFISQMSAGNYQVDWEGLNAQNKEFNQTNVAGELILMREKMQRMKQEDERRLWSTEGLAKFGEILRSDKDLKLLGDSILSNLVKYIKANQAAFFMVNDNDSHAIYLEMISCYAFNRKKFMEKRLEIGQGLVGQCYLEKDLIHLTKIPDNYISITSGLGDANPNSILVLPLIHNGTIEGVIEIASFNKFQEHEIAFVQKLAESISATISSAKTNERTKLLLEESQMQAEAMRAQEEEMRQNMEELSATQEEIHRKERDYIRRIEELEEALAAANRAVKAEA
jgi:hypothetical protein